MRQNSAETAGTGEGGSRSGPGKQKLGLKARAFEEGKKFLIITLYLWVFFVAINLHKTAILHQNHISYEAEGFAIVNALVFAKVMLLADSLKVGTRFRGKPLIYAVLYASFLFACILIGFHILEGIVVALLRGRAVSEGLTDLDAGDPKIILSYGVIAFVALIPFFLFRGITRVVGENQIWHLVFTDGKGALNPPKE